MTIKLTPAETKIVQLVSKGMGRLQIAQTLFNSPKTIDSHLITIYDKIESHGYHRNLQQIAALYLSSPQIFELDEPEVRKDTKRFYAVMMLRQRMHYKLIADRLGMKPTSVCMYKGKIPKSDFCSMPYLRLISPGVIPE
jgi:DNA-binding CsgD family transcriptional regulator